MLLEITLKEALEALEEPQIIHKEIIIPEKTPTVLNSPYRVGYDWLFFYERSLFRILAPWLKHYRYKLIGKEGILSEMLSNAYCHGHKRDATLPIRVAMVAGKRGLIVLIEDTGQGFIVRKIKEDFDKGKNYYHLAGNGIRLVIESEHFGIFYNKKGNVVHLLYMFDDQAISIGNVCHKLRGGMCQ